MHSIQCRLPTGPEHFRFAGLCVHFSVRAFVCIFQCWPLCAFFSQCRIVCAPFSAGLYVHGFSLRVFVCTVFHCGPLCARFFTAGLCVHGFSVWAFVCVHVLVGRGVAEDNLRCCCLNMIFLPLNKYKCKRTDRIKFV